MDAEFNSDPIIIDTSLSPLPQNLTDVHVHGTITSTLSKIFTDVNETTKFIANTVPDPTNTVFLHRNLMQYLMLAWSNHFSVVISPDMIFYTVLCEIADEIKTKPDAYRHLFTDSLQKKTVTTIGHTADLEKIIHEISQMTPVDTSIFTANFSSSTVESRLAIQAAFCEAMSTYYIYVTSLCGIPRVKVLGTKQDWQTLEHKIHRMRTEVFNQDATTEKKMSAYLGLVESQVHKIHTTRDPAFWKDMFRVEGCESGTSDRIGGWITSFYRNGSHDFANYESHISTVKWASTGVQMYHELRCGLLYSNIVRGDSEDDVKYPWLEPQFSHVILEAKKPFEKYVEEKYTGRDKDVLLALQAFVTKQ